MAFMFIGYLIRLPDNRIVNYSSNRAQAKEFCAQNKIPEESIIQIFHNAQPTPITEHQPDEQLSTVN